MLTPFKTVFSDEETNHDVQHSALKTRGIAKPQEEGGSFSDFWEKLARQDSIAIEHYTKMTSP